MESVVEGCHGTRRSRHPCMAGAEKRQGQVALAKGQGQPSGQRVDDDAMVISTKPRRWLMSRAVEHPC